MLISFLRDIGVCCEGMNISLLPKDVLWYVLQKVFVRTVRFYGYKDRFLSINRFWFTVLEKQDVVICERTCFENVMVVFLVLACTCKSFCSAIRKHIIAHSIAPKNGRKIGCWGFRENLCLNE